MFRYPPDFNGSFCVLCNPKDNERRVGRSLKSLESWLKDIIDAVPVDLS